MVLTKRGNQFIIEKSVVIESGLGRKIMWSLRILTLWFVSEYPMWTLAENF